MGSQYWTREVIVLSLLKTRNLIMLWPVLASIDRYLEAIHVWLRGLHLCLSEELADLQCSHLKLSRNWFFEPSLLSHTAILLMGQHYLSGIPHNYTGEEKFSFRLTLLYTQAIGVYAFLSTLHNAKVTASNISKDKAWAFNIISLSSQQIL